ncbi:DUF2158 domain-containing protein [Pseudoxanthomonas winnipegensis]|uniref:DUF2158 domain-containing protein n=1 Tax=Pseudoxanthomonas winnipegensis TaxID=2480810 RepID=A0ABY1WJP8_9GAMM|nr:DUF2158 domain-containing protein [Pseudoxanthomonas winnipegensis]TAA09770.1 DUF2158 domain-containing protein [Pseudoxanthomonas winnipegensis]TAA22851.1 DUF2158 domain-containing protein [Pseudoxanthomonas winnipegensis]TAH73263.1 DUF2158 domain-containing protein [Pseudoxanthomonas winnipegensis]
MAESNTFAVGDIVKLKSGGPDMTVKVTPELHSQHYTCQWFAGKKLEQGNFPGHSLEQVENA